MEEKYYVLELTSDGPCQTGDKSHDNEKSAVKSAEAHCRRRPSSKFGVFKEVGQYWCDPNPSVLSNLEKS